MSELGLFPLSLVLLPTEQVPLHIFEERYKELIGECIETEAEFGLVFADDDGLREIGTRAAVLEVLARDDEGRMDIVVEGRDRFRLRELTTGRSFHTGETEPFVDDDDPAPDVHVEQARELFDRLRELTGSEVPIPDADTQQLSYALAARVHLADAVKLELLGSTSERVRLERVTDLLEEAILAVSRQRRAAERAATNGKVDLG